MNTVKHQSSTGWRLVLGLLPIMAIIWLHLFLRLHNIGDSLPYFIDEIRHIERARIVWTFQDFHTSTTPSKFGTYYWLGLFGLPEFPDPWIGRAPVALFTILGVAGTYALGKEIFGRNSGLVAALIVAVWPFLLFFERLALTDPPTASLIVITAWWSIIVAKHPTNRRAYILGVFICLMLAAKLLSGLLMIAPFLAVLLYGKYPLTFRKALWPQLVAIWRSYWPYIWRTSTVIVGVWGIILGTYLVRRIIDPKVGFIVDAYLYDGGIQEDKNYIMQNLERTEQVLIYHWSLLLVGLALFALVIIAQRNWRNFVFFTLLIFPLILFLIFIARELSTRYLTNIAHLCAVVIAGGVVQFAQTWQPKPSTFLRFVPLGLLIGWGISFSLPFAVKAMQDPQSLTLPERDRTEYFGNYTGYAIPDAFELVSDISQQDQYDEMPFVVAILRICDHHPNYFMPMELRGTMDVNCQPYFSAISPLDGRVQKRYDRINAGAEEYGLIYVMVERFPPRYGDEIFDTRRIAGVTHFIGRFVRPYDGIPIEVYEVQNIFAIALNHENTP